MEKNLSAVIGIRLRKAILCGFVFVAIFVLFLLLLAYGLEKELIQQGRGDIWTRALLCVTSVGASWLSARNADQKKLLIGLLGSGTLAVFLIFLGVFTKNSSVFNISLLYSLLAVLFGGFLGSLLAADHRKQRRRTRRYYKQ